MNKLAKLILCNRLLLLLTVATLVSGIQLEATHSSGVRAVWIHILVGAAFMTMIVWHLYLHFKWKSWIKRLRSQKSHVTHWLALSGAFAFATGIASAIHWALTYVHAPLGGVHGKLGFLFIALAIGHAVKRIKFYKR